MEAYERLEKEFAAWNGLDAQGMVSCSTGTAALHLALEALQLPQASEILIPDFTMIACPRAAIMARLTPVFVDCDDRLLMDLLCMERATTDREVDDPKRYLSRPISAIMAVHVYGRKCSEDLLEVADLWNMKLVEDLAECHGVKPYSNTDAACWSFYKNKIVSGGEEGGAVWYKDKEAAERARSLRSLGFMPAHDFSHIPRGHNYRMSNAHARLILDWAFNKLSNGDLRADDLIKARHEIVSWFDEDCPKEWKMPPRQSPWVYDLRIPDMTAQQQDSIVVSLKAKGIQARHAFKPMSYQEEFRECRLVKSDIHRALAASREVIYLPIVPGHSSREIAKLAFETIQDGLA